jgi:hypothetical protein
MVHPGSVQLITTEAWLVKVPSLGVSTQGTALTMMGLSPPITALGDKPGTDAMALRMLPVFVMDRGDVHTGESTVGVVPSRVQWIRAPEVAVEMLMSAFSVNTHVLGLSSGGDALMKKIPLRLIGLIASIGLIQIALMIVSVCCS